tara:strand:- start:2711 stop:3058 length:348 start_codon:yes stop_codon:yes gene_type:complete
MARKTDAYILESGKRALELHASGLTWREVAAKLGLPLPTIYNHARKCEASPQIEPKVEPKLKSKPTKFDDFSFKLYIAHIDGKSFVDIGNANEVAPALAEKMIRNYARSRGLPLR